jgi:hypothetical protein
MNAQCLDLDLHRLDLRFAGARVAEPRAVERIARSIECGGQIVPCIAVADSPVEVLEARERLVLIDGYRRVAALRRRAVVTVLRAMQPAQQMPQVIHLRQRLVALDDRATPLRPRGRDQRLQRLNVCRKLTCDPAHV